MLFQKWLYPDHAVQRNTTAPAYKADAVVFRLYNRNISGYIFVILCAAMKSRRKKM